MPGHHDSFKTSITGFRLARPNSPLASLDQKSTDTFLTPLDVLAARLGCPSVGSWSKMWGKPPWLPHKRPAYRIKHCGGLSWGSGWHLRDLSMPKDQNMPEPPVCRHRFDAPLADIGHYDDSLKKAVTLKSPRTHDHIAHRSSVQVQSIAIANQESKRLRCSKPR